MERLRQLVSRIAAQMSVLTVSQRLAIGLCAALIVGSLLWLLQWSAAPELIPLVNYEFSYENLQAAEDALQTEGIKFRTHGTRIFVRQMDKPNAIRVVHSADALPEGSLYDMAAAVADQNPFQSPEARKYAQTYAKGNEVAKIIATYPFVKKASVLINDQSKRRLGGGSFVPTASVVVTLTPGKEMAAETVDGFARLVAGAVAGLKPYNVNVTDSRTGRSYTVPHPDDVATVDYLAVVKKHEAHLLSKVLNKLADIPGIRATVTVELDTSKRVTQTVKHAPPQPKVETEQTSESSTTNAPTEPGIQANLGQALTAGGGGPSTSMGETKTEYYEPTLSRTETIEQMPFARRKVTATVGIPRSFVVGVFQALHPDKPDAGDDDPDFVAVRDDQLARVRSSVEKIVMAKDPGDVEVDIYPDMEWSADGGGWSTVPGGVAAAVETSATLDPVGLTRAYGPPVGLLMLALMSLFMMTRIVRKSSEITGRIRQGPPDLGEDHEEESILAVGPRAIGQAEVSESLLTGKEVDGDTLRYHELGDEVAKLVEADPDGTAELIRRWVEEEE